jgi:hypothetical protein
LNLKPLCLLLVFEEFAEELYEMIREYELKTRELKEILVEENLIKEMEEDKDLGMVIKEMNAELREDEYLDDKHVENLEYYCVKFIEKWIARFLR